MRSRASIDVGTPELQIVRAILRRHVPEREVWAFGSRVTGKARRFSDLDLVVMGDAPLGLSTMAALTEDFSESDLPFKVDVLDWAVASSSFREIIKAAMVAVQTAGDV